MHVQAVARSLEAELPLAVTGSDRFVLSALAHPMWREYAMAEVVEGTSQASAVALLEGQDTTYSIDPPKIQSTIATVTSGIRLASHLLERERQQHGLYTVHGNVISIGKKTIALVGGISGIGKTTLSAQSTEQGWKWIADEKFIIDLDGNYRFGRSTILDDEKTHKAAGAARPTAPMAPHAIFASVIPIITDGSLTVHEYSPGKALYHYYEELSRDITGARALFTGHDFPLPSVDTPLLSARRRSVAEHLSESCPMYYMLGTASAILAAIEDRIRVN